MGVSAKYGFELYREIKEMRQKNDCGLIKYGFEYYKEVNIWLIGSYFFLIHINKASRQFERTK